MDLAAGTSQSCQDLDIDVDFGAILIIKVPSYEESGNVVKKYRMKHDPNVKEVRNFSYRDNLETWTLLVKYINSEIARREYQKMTADFQDERLSVVVADDFLDKVNRLEDLHQQKDRQLGYQGMRTYYVIFLDTDQLNLSDEEDTEQGRLQIAQLLCKAFEKYGKVMNFSPEKTMAFHFTRYASAYASFLAYYQLSWKAGNLALEIDSPDDVVEALNSILE